jgi:murein hydrolase activator
MTFTRFVFFALFLGITLQVAPLSAKTKSKKPTASKERRSQEAELARIKSEIRKTEALLRDHEQKEKRTKANVAAYDARTKELRSKLTGLNTQARSLEAELAELNTSMQETTTSLTNLKESYANDVTKRYTSGVYREKQADVFLLGDPAANTERIRQAYMGRIATTAVMKNQNMLDSTQDVLAENITDVTQSLQSERAAISETKKQEKLAQIEKQKQATELKNIQQRKAALQKELDRRRADAKRLEGFIANLIAKEEAERKAAEEARKKRLAELKKKKAAGKKLTAKEKKQEEVDSKPVAAAAGPRSLSWPVNSRKIAQGFGEVRNAELGTVTMNLGIDIAVATGSAVRAAEDGTVSIVSSLPSYGTIVIINHSGGIHTVYADLGGANVSRGAKVKRGDVIGSSGENSELGGILHFEVWKGRNKQNPMGWLR